MELVAGFGMAYFRPCLTMIRGGDAAEGSDILQTANRNLSPNGGGEPTGELAEAIDRDFGSF